MDVVRNDYGAPATVGLAIMSRNETILGGKNKNR
ncbi:hypothetical protein CNECB9_740007 [Cupriavidus necator]|uniref:Uncharacterized protein n=1 Tax=Cupriavidus necator TaxID=106590 RepID=A0A1K0IS20_CUPNE|nr:hypothetical protein CNECB9_740007 [Cupriavidus necator]